MSENKYTDPPLIVTTDKFGCPVVVKKGTENSGTGYLYDMDVVCEISDMTEKGFANADRIVHCNNHFDGLVAALNKIKKCANDHPNNFERYNDLVYLTAKEALENLQQKDE